MTRFYRKAKGTKEEILSAVCGALNRITNTQKYGLLKGWDCAEIVTSAKYNKLLTQKNAVVLPDGVIKITMG